MTNSYRFKTVIAFAVPVVLALALAGVCIWSSVQIEEAGKEKAALENEVQAAYRQAVYQLSDNINDMQTALKKLQVTNSTTQHVLLLSDVWRLSGAAVACMANVPDSHVDAAETSQFVARAGDYARVQSRRILDGAVLTNEDYAQLESLYEASVQIGNELKNRLDSNDFPAQSLDAEGYYTASGGGAAENGGSGSADGAGTASEKSEESIADYPTLIYDGPFSESNETTAPRGLPAGEVDEAAAKEKALSYLGGGSLNASGPEEGTIPVYGFYGADADGRSVEITVTRQGGAVLWMMAETPMGEDGVPEEATVARMKDAAKAYLDARGYDGMEATYAQFYDGIGVFNFAATQGDVILYADLVKVYVERAGSRVVGVDANNYLMRHAPRTPGTPLIDEQTARAAVSEALKIVSVRLALIPKTASTETLCYEFKGTRGETDFIVYINATTGAEEEIYEIINSDEGQLVV